MMDVAWHAGDFFFAMTSGEDRKEQQERRQKELEEARTLEKEGKGDRALSASQAVYLLSLYSGDSQALGEARRGDRAAGRETRGNLGHSSCLN